MDAAAANARLRELGYEPEDASVARNGERDRLVLWGELVNEAVVEAEDVEALLAMLPPKSHLLAYRFVLGRSLSPEAKLATRCAWCGSFSKDGRHWFRANLAPVTGTPASGGICPSCFAAVAPGTPYP